MAPTDELTQAHIQAQAQLRQIAVAAAASTWVGLRSHDQEDVPGFLARLLPLVAAINRQSALLTIAYLARAIDRPITGIDIPTLLSGLRTGTSPQEAYRRPFVTTWSELTRGRSYADAVDAGRQRATAIAATDVQLAMTHTVRAVAQTQPETIFGFERVPDPNACDLCLIASTQRYRTDQLMPIHNHCGCGIRPLLEPTSREINKDLYRQLKSEHAMDSLTAQRRARGFQDRAAANRRRADDARRQLAAEDNPTLRKRLNDRADSYDTRAAEQLRAAAELRDGHAPATTVAVRHHGELGPVLTDAAHHFLTKADALAR
jgi:hypothetical protein